MKRKGLFLGSLMVALVISWTSVALASTVGFDYTTLPYDWHGTSTIQTFGSGINTGFYSTPTKAGLFSQQVIESVSMPCYYRNIGYPDIMGSFFDPGPYPSIPTNITMYMYSPTVTYWVDIFQDGPLRFTDFAWEIKVLKDGTETTLFSLSANADLITGYGKSGLGNAYYDADVFSFPGELVYEEWGGTMGYPGWYAQGSGSVNFTYLVSMTGHVIDITAPVPLPPTVFLLGSGLLGLAGWRRFRKS